MKTTLALSASIALALSLIAGCSKSTTTNNPVSGGPASFSLVVGSTFQFQQWKIDTNNVIIDSGSQFVHQRISDSGLTIDGMTNAYRVLDSTFDSTTFHLLSLDTLYLAASGGKLYEYGGVANIFQLVSGYAILPPRWDLIANIGNSSSWQIDTTSAAPAGLIPLNVVVYGVDHGAANVMLRYTNTVLSSDHVSNSGTITVSDSGVPPQIINFSGEIYSSYNPAIISQLIIHPILSNGQGGSIDGLQRELISFHL